MEPRIEPHRAKRRPGDRHAKAAEPKACAHCGAMYYPPRAKADQSRFCSRLCRNVGVGRATKGEDNGNWKGGISTDRVHYTGIQAERYPERVAARKAALAAIAAGKLVRQPCEVCGTTEDVQAHHEDYSKPLEVKWLCRPDHRALHEAERQAGREDAA